MDSPPNVVWLTLDSLRYDHTTMSGYRWDTTPNLAAIAESDEGRSIEHCYAHSNFTLPSTASILTGTYPSYHGVGMDVNDAIPAAIDTVQTRLSRAGYRTGCISQIPRVSHSTGFARGFDDYEYALGYGNLLTAKKPVDTVRAGLSHLRRNILPGLHQGRFDPLALYTGYPLEYTTRRTTSLLKAYEDADEPFFLYVQTRAPHYPYRPPLSLLDEFLEDTSLSAQEALDLSLEVYDDERIKQTIAKDEPLSTDELAAIEAMYDASVRHADRFVGDVHSLLQEDRFEDTILVVTADHGDLFGEHDLIAHKFVLHDGLVRVPLVLSGIARLAPVAPDDIVQHADLVRTFVGAAGGDVEGLQGIDLREDERDLAIIEGGPNEQSFDAFLAHNPDFDTDRFHHGHCVALRDRRFKYEYADGRGVLYEPPDEETDRRDEYPDVTERFEVAMSKWRASIDGPVRADESSTSDYSEEMEKHLRQLGYR